MGTLKDQIKLGLRWSHNYLDAEIEQKIEAARAEMVRAGVSPDMVVDETDALIVGAIQVYCYAFYANDVKEREGYEKSFYFQLENLRKSGGYGINV